MTGEYRRENVTNGWSSLVTLRRGVCAANSSTVIESGHIFSDVRAENDHFLEYAALFFT